MGTFGNPLHRLVNCGRRWGYQHRLPQEQLVHVHYCLVPAYLHQHWRVLNCCFWTSLQSRPEHIERLWAEIHIMLCGLLNEEGLWLARLKALSSFPFYVGEWQKNVYMLTKNAGRDGIFVNPVVSPTLFHQFFAYQVLPYGPLYILSSQMREAVEKLFEKMPARLVLRATETKKA